MVSNSPEPPKRICRRKKREILIQGRGADYPELYTMDTDHIYAWDLQEDGELKDRTALLRTLAEFCQKTTKDD